MSAKDYTQNPGTHLIVCPYSYHLTLAKHVELIQLHTNVGSHSTDKLKQFMVLGLQPCLLIRRCASVCLGFLEAKLRLGILNTCGNPATFHCEARGEAAEAYGCM